MLSGSMTVQGCLAAASISHATDEGLIVPGYAKLLWSVGGSRPHVCEVLAIFRRWEIPDIFHQFMHSLHRC